VDTPCLLLGLRLLGTTSVSRASRILAWGRRAKNHISLCSVSALIRREFPVKPWFWEPPFSDSSSLFCPIRAIHNGETGCIPRSQPHGDWIYNVRGHFFQGRSINNLESRRGKAVQLNGFGPFAGSRFLHSDFQTKTPSRPRRIPVAPLIFHWNIALGIAYRVRDDAVQQFRLGLHDAICGGPGQMDNMLLFVGDFRLIVQFREKLLEFCGCLLASTFPAPIPFKVRISAISTRIPSLRSRLPNDRSLLT